jgi:hypothetical protein
MKEYKFVGDYKKLKKLGYSRTKWLEFDGYQMWSKTGEDYSVVVFNFVSVKVWRNNIGYTYTDIEFVEPYIRELIDNGLVEVVDVD